jgi:hypothetical protein
LTKNNNFTDVRNKKVRSKKANVKITQISLAKLIYRCGIGLNEEPRGTHGELRGTQRGTQRGTHGEFRGLLELIPPILENSWSNSGGISHTTAWW